MEVAFFRDKLFLGFLLVVAAVMAVSECLVRSPSLFKESETS